MSAVLRAQSHVRIEETSELLGLLYFVEHRPCTHSPFLRSRVPEAVVDSINQLVRLATGFGPLMAINSGPPSGGRSRRMLSHLCHCRMCPMYYTVDKNVAAESRADSKYDPLAGEPPDKERGSMKHTLATAPICSPSTQPREVIGIDLGDRWSRYCLVDQAGMVVEEDRVRTTPEALTARFGELPATRTVIEVGAHSPWVGRLLQAQGHEVVVANPRKVRLIYESDLRTIDWTRACWLG
jgi:hypothetical protein